MTRLAWRLTAGCLLCLTGCVLFAPSYGSVFDRIPPLLPDKGRLIVVRYDELAIYGFQPRVLVDDHIAGNAVPGGFFFVDLDPGKHRLTTEVPASGPRARDGDALPITIVAGQAVYVVVAPGAFDGRGPALELRTTDSAHGETLVRASCYVGGSLLEPPLTP